MSEVNGGLLARAALLGAATGSRSMLGLASVAIAGGRRTPGAPYSTGVVALASAGELVGDKLPQTPSRLNAGGIGIRLVMGGACGAVLAHRDRAAQAELAEAAAVGIAAAAVTTWAGARWRAFASRRFGRDMVGALIEDGVAASAAVAAVRS